MSISEAMEQKICTKCKVRWPITKFSRRGDGYQSWCKDCNKKHKKDWIQDNRDKVRWNTLWTKYRIRKEDWERLMEEQGGLCALCAEEEPTVVDHNHTTGEVRGLLCNGCNVFVGHVETTPARLRNLEKYLGPLV